MKEFLHTLAMVPITIATLIMIYVFDITDSGTIFLVDMVVYLVSVVVFVYFTICVASEAGEKILDKLFDR
jgi:hypothetical protein